MNKKSTRAIITMIMVAVLCLIVECPSMGAETTDKIMTTIEEVVEENIEESAASEEAGEGAGQDQSGAIKTNDEVVSVDENAKTDFEAEKAELASENNSDKEDEEQIDIEDSEQIEKSREAESDNPGDESIAQAIWTTDNSTLTFYYGSLVSVGDDFNGYKATKVWSGLDVTETGNRTPGWCSSRINTVLFDDSFYVVKPTSMYGWFYGCYQLSVIDFSGLDTSEVTNMGKMFYDCYSNSLTSLDLSNFNTSSVTDMNNMFNNCRGLTGLDLSSFETSNVEDMSGMFQTCHGLTNLDLSSFDTSGVKGMNRMFRECIALKSLDLSGFDTSKVTDMNRMFDHCFKLAYLDISSFDTSCVTDMSNMFNNCFALANLDVSGFDTSNVTDMSGMFNSNALSELDVRGFDTSNVTDMGGMFQCINITALDLSGFDTSNVTNMALMFSGCNSLSSLDLSNFDTSKVKYFGGMFTNCVALNSIDVSGFDTSNAIGIGRMFWNCPKLVNVDVSGFDTAKATSMEEMFYKCSSLTSIDVSGFDTKNITNMSGMFRECRNLASIDVSGFNTSNVEDISGMFCECNSLTNIDVSGFETSKVTNMGELFYNCKQLTSIDVSNFNTSNSTSMKYMFYGCKNLTSIDVSEFDVSKSTDWGALMGMFYDCTNLTTIYCADNTTDWSVVSSGPHMFLGCTSLVGKDGSTQVFYDSNYYEESMAKSAGLGGYFTPKISSSTSNTNGTIIERVREYTSDEMLAQLNQITNSNDPSEVKFHRMNALFANYGFTDAKEGVHYLSNTHDKRYAYLMLTTDETYCANNYVDWLKSGTLAAARRALLFADGLIFNNEINDWLSFTTYSETEFPGVKKYKTMLYDFMDASSKSIEIQSGIKFASDLASKSTGTARIEAENIVNQLNNCSTVAEERAILTQASNEGIYVELAEARDENGNILLNYKLDESSGFGEFQKLMGYGTKTLSIANMTIADIMDIIELDSKLATYTQYKHFLQEVVADTSVPFQLRWAASLIISELDAGYLGEIKDVAMDIIGQTELNSTVKKAILTKIGAQSLSSWLTAINTGAFFSNQIANVGEMVKKEAYVEGYYYLSKSYKTTLEESKAAFIQNPTEANAWEFYYNYNILYRLRYKGEEAYLKFSEIKGIAAIFSDFGYSDKKAVVDNTLKLLRDRCQFTFTGAKNIPESCQFASKAVVKCPVDVDVVASDGTIMATLEDGTESDVTNSYGRFAVVYDYYSQDYYKVICLNQNDNYTIKARGNKKGLVSVELATAGDEDEEIYVINNIPIESGEVITASETQITEEGTITRYAEEDQEGTEEPVTVTNGNYVPAESIALDNEELSLKPGDSALIGVVFEPANTSNQGVFWHSLDPEVATVENGRVEALAEGTTTIYCTPQDNSELFKVCTVNVAKAVVPIDSVSIEGIEDKTYTGKEITQQIVITDGNVSLVEGTDYTVTYENNINAGIAKVIVTGIGSYTGTVEKEFNITAKEITPTVTLAPTAFVYSGTVRKPSVTVKDGSTKLTTTDYTVKYASGRKNPGTYKVVVVLKGNYSGNKAAYFKINPKGTALVSLTAGSKKMTVKWKKQATQITGYQIQYATDSKFTKNKKTITVKGTKATAKTITKLTGGKKYYARIRTYKTVSNKNYYSKWSKMKSITVRK